MKLKISTLFHWLFATLMFLPILMFIPSCLYYGFNEHATNETTTQINYKYQSNEVNTFEDLIEGNIYYSDRLNLTPYEIYGNTASDYFIIQILKFDNATLGIYPYNIDETIACDYSNNELNFIEYSYNGDNTALVDFTNGNCYVAFLVENHKQIIFENVVFSITDGFDNALEYFSDTHSLFEYTDYNVIESVETNVQDTISNKMYLAWEGVWNLPLFEWTKNSFITAPFSYITGLFGLGSDNSLNCVFTYFASISICWLVFDLIMYVPNLAHRWLDRSSLE